MVPIDQGRTIREAGRKTLIEAIRLIGPPKLERAAPAAPPPNSSSSSATPKDATEAAWMLRDLAIKTLGKQAGHTDAVKHQVMRASVNENGTILRIVCTCGTNGGAPVVVNSGGLPDPKLLGKIVSLGVKSVP